MCRCASGDARIFFSEREKSVPAMRVTTLVNKLIGLQVRGFHFQADKARVVVDGTTEEEASVRDLRTKGRSLQSTGALGPVRSPDLSSLVEWYVGGVEWSEKRCLGPTREAALPKASRGSVAGTEADVSAVANYFRVTWRSGDGSSSEWLRAAG